MLVFRKLGHLRRRIAYPISANRKLAQVKRKNTHAVRQLLSSDLPVRLELGAGRRQLAGWTSVDQRSASDICTDITSPLPFPDNTVSEVYCSHLLEHFYYPDILKLLTEIKRVLIYGGMFRCAVPNARIYLKGYFQPEDFETEYYCRHEPAFFYHTPIDYVNYMAYMNGHHKHLFDEDNLLAILAAAGFRDVSSREFDPEIDLQERDYESIYAKAKK